MHFLDPIEIIPTLCNSDYSCSSSRFWPCFLLMREVLGIAKKDFQKVIIDVIKWKRQIIAETIMTKALNIHISVDEEYEIS